jgi:hypothetical protein
MAAISKEAMVLLEQQLNAPSVGGTRVTEDAERDARRSMREQIARLERDLAGTFVTMFEMGGTPAAATALGEPRLLGLGELERVRDDLAERLRAARAAISSLGERQAANRLLLERILLEPGKYKFARISARDLGEPSCAVWQVRPRLGLIGMLMGWWQVKLSSGCPLPGGRGLAAARSAPPAGPTRTD